MPAAVGQATHAGVEALQKPLPLRPEKALQRAFEHEVASVPADEVTADPGAFSDATAMLARYQEEVTPTFHPTMVEQPFVLRTLGVRISGVIDSADERIDELRDLKTTAQVSKFRPERYQLQATLYDWGYAALTGRHPRRIALDVLGRNGRIMYRQFEMTPDHAAAQDVIGIVRDGILRESFEPTGAISGQCRWCPFKRVCTYVRV